MKVLIEILVITLLILLGWRQSYCEHLGRIFPNSGLTQTSRRTAPASPAASPPLGENQWAAQRKK